MEVQIYTTQLVSDILMPVCVLSRSVVSDSWRPCGLQPSRLLCPGDSSGKNTGASCPPPGDLPDPGIKPVSLVPPALAGSFITTALMPINKYKVGSRLVMLLGCLAIASAKLLWTEKPSIQTVENSHIQWLAESKFKVKIFKNHWKTIYYERKSQ